MYSKLASVLYHETTILARLDELAREISRDYASRELTVVFILHGSLFFVADLLRRVNLPLRISSLDVASYHGGTTSSGTITFNQIALPDVRGRHVLLIDDILDTGRTLATIRQRLMDEAGPAGIRIAVLLEKRRPREVPITADYVGFEIGDEFVVGYGLDFQGHFRNLPCIGILRNDAGPV